MDATTLWLIVGVILLLVVGLVGFLAVGRRRALRTGEQPRDVEGPTTRLGGARQRRG